MAAKIRLARTGRKKIVRYRIVVADTRFKRDGRYIETLGYYNPQSTPKEFSLNAERIAYWVKTGAQISETVSNLLKEDSFDQKKEAIEKGVALDTIAIQRQPERKRKPKAKKQKAAAS